MQTLRRKLAQNKHVLRKLPEKQNSNDWLKKPLHVKRKLNARQQLLHQHLQQPLHKLLSLQKPEAQHSSFLQQGASLLDSAAVTSEPEQNHTLEWISPTHLEHQLLPQRAVWFPTQAIWADTEMLSSLHIPSTARHTLPFMAI